MKSPEYFEATGNEEIDKRLKKLRNSMSENPKENMYHELKTQSGHTAYINMTETGSVHVVIDIAGDNFSYQLHNQKLSRITATDAEDQPITASEQIKYADAQSTLLSQSNEFKELVQQLNNSGDFETDS